LLFAPFEFLDLLPVDSESVPNNFCIMLNIVDGPGQVAFAPSIDDRERGIGYAFE
jgi:hypothetical protein